MHIFAFNQIFKIMQMQTTFSIIYKLNALKHGEWLVKLINDYENERNYLETSGDLEDIYQFIINELHDIPLSNIGTESPLLQLQGIWNFTNYAQNICRPEDIYDIPTIQEFKTKYPALMETFVTWAWG